jgi:hypothetical protein
VTYVNEEPGTLVQLSNVGHYFVPGDGLATPCIYVKNFSLVKSIITQIWNKPRR